jgi:sarcosine oxidase gamma subunit
MVFRFGRPFCFYSIKSVAEKAGKFNHSFSGVGAMRAIDIEEARANLEELIDALKPGEWFVISKGGIPRVKVRALTQEEIEHLPANED